MDNKVITESVIPMAPDGFISVTNHSNCTKFEGNLSPPQNSHEKILVSFICRLAGDLISGDHCPKCLFLPYFIYIICVV